MTGKEGHCVFQTRQYSWSSAQNMTKMQLWLICSLIQLSEVAEAWIFFSYFPFFFPTNKSHFVCILLLSFLSLQYRWPRVHKRIELLSLLRKWFILRRLKWLIIVMGRTLLNKLERVHLLVIDLEHPIFGYEQMNI